MRTVIALAALGLVSAPALAAPQSAAGTAGGLRIYSPGQFNAVAETPSRLERSREEMNRGRNPSIPAAPGPVAVRRQAEAVVARAGLVCTVVEAGIIGRTRDGGALIEIDCAEGGGVVAADTDPIQITDCLDLAPDNGQSGRRQRVVDTCHLPGNAGLAERSQSARN